MPTSIESLKEAIQHEKNALAHYKAALETAAHQETKDALGKFLKEKEQSIDTLSWLIVAEAGELPKETESPHGEGKPATGKCPFTAQLAAMGVDMSKMTEGMDMSKMDMSKIADMMKPKE